MTITTREDKGSALSHSEMDENITDLRDIPTGKVFPKTKGIGIKIDTDDPDWGWNDITGSLFADPNLPDAAEFAIYRNNIRAYQFDENDATCACFHMPHDYAMGTEIYIHVHWSHASALVTGGSVTWSFEIMYAKGHNQAPFPAPIVVSVQDNISLTQYQHQIAEGVASTPGGSPVLLDTNELEVDGIIQSRLLLDSNDITVSSGDVPKPYAHFVDIHYQSTGLPTKNRLPDFWT